MTIAEGGVLPNIHSVLLTKKKGKKGGEEESASQVGQGGWGGGVGQGGWVGGWRG